MPPVTQTLILINGIVFILQLAGGSPLIYWGALWPLGAGFAPWQLVTYSFLHGGITHIFFNMFALYMFGGDLERLFGPRWYLALYLVSVVTAGLTQLVFAAATHAPPFPTIGASGGVFGLLLTFGMYFPRRMIMLIFPPIPMRAWVFVTVYGILELVLGVTGTEAGVAHFAHLGGMLGAYIMVQQRRGRFPFSRRRR